MGTKGCPASHHPQGMASFRPILDFRRCRILTILFFRLFNGLLESPDGLAQSVAHIRQLSGSENEHGNDQNNDKFRHTDSKHGGSPFLVDYLAWASTRLWILLAPIHQSFKLQLFM
jgi:hypothetical protein